MTRVLARIRSVAGCSVVAVLFSLLGACGAAAIAADAAPVTGDVRLDALAPWLGGSGAGAAVWYALAKVYGLIDRAIILAEQLIPALVAGKIRVPLDVHHHGRVVAVDEPAAPEP